MENTENLTINEGTISFWIKEKSIIFNDNKTTELFKIYPVGGSISMTKDSSNKLKVIYIAIGSGGINLEYDVSKVNCESKHMISLTWSVGGGNINLYFDGKLVESSALNFM